MSSGAVSKGSKDSKPKKPKHWRELKLTDKVFVVGFGSVVLVMVYAFLWFFLATPVNKAFHHSQECTITAAVNRSSGARSYSSSSNIYIQSPDCSHLVYEGKRYGLTNDEIVERIRELEGQRVSVDVGVWQMPFSSVTSVVGIEGLDLSK
ncbi:hypothetical protein [Rothia nasimurium]|uniref:hypothetical protein n=1 Tax=Rothia nasimurium TaxID=85336 RepID=UPI001627E604|nr:hypothetical protein [Rothia nasimurium]